MKNIMNDLKKEWTAKIEFLKANAAKADTEQKIRYLEYIDSLRARQQNLQDMDLTRDEFGGPEMSGNI